MLGKLSGLELRLGGLALGLGVGAATCGGRVFGRHPSRWRVTSKSLIPSLQASLSCPLGIAEAPFSVEGEREGRG